MKEDLADFLEELRYGDLLNSPTKLDLANHPYVDVDAFQDIDTKMLEWREMIRYEGLNGDDCVVPANK